MVVSGSEGKRDTQARGADEHRGFDDGGACAPSRGTNSTAIGTFGLTLDKPSQDRVSHQRAKAQIRETLSSDQYRERDQGMRCRVGVYEVFEQVRDTSEDGLQNRQHRADKPGADANEHRRSNARVTVLGQHADPLHQFVEPPTGQ